MQANVSCVDCLAMVNIVISLFPSFVFLKQLIYLFIVLFINFFLVSNKVHPHHFSAVEKYWSQQQSFENTEKYIFE